MKEHITLTKPELDEFVVHLINAGLIKETNDVEYQDQPYHGPEITFWLDGGMGKAVRFGAALRDFGHLDRLLDAPTDVYGDYQFGRIVIIAKVTAD